MDDNGSNGWKWATIILIALIVMVLCCVLGAILGGLMGFGVGLGRRLTGRFEAPYAEEEPPVLPFPDPEEFFPPQEEVDLPWLGVYYRMVEEGAEITGVVYESPADESGLRAGDIIQEIDGEAVTEMNPLGIVIMNYEPGDRVQLTLLRNGEEEQISVRLGKRPPEPEFPEEEFIPPVPGDG